MKPQCLIILCSSDSAGKGKPEARAARVVVFCIQRERAAFYFPSPAMVSALETELAIWLLFF